MDLNLSLSYQEQNDNKAIILTDTTDNFDAENTTHLVNGDAMTAGLMYEIVTQATVPFDSPAIGAADNNPGTRFVAGSGSSLGPGDEVKEVNPRPDEITAATLDTIITGVDGTPVTKSQVDLFAEFGPFATQDDMVYTITALLLGDTADTLLVDGLYELDYAVTYTGEVNVNSYYKTDTLNVTILVYGQVKVATYEKLRQVPVLYMCQDGCPTAEISEADLCGAYLSGIENSAYIAKTEELLNMLIVLDNIIKNGSNITW